MSQASGPLADRIVSVVSSFHISKYCAVGPTALVLYDHVCTIPQELQCIWKSKITSTIFIFHANRWLILVYAILNIVQEFSHPGAIISCAMLDDILFAVEVCLFVLWAAFSGVRVYAISGGSRFLSFVVAFLNLVPVGTNAYETFYSVSWLMVNLPMLGLQCVEKRNITETTNTRLEISTRAPVITADIIVLVLTWWKTWATVRMAREHDVKTPFATLLLRDGTLYFIGLLSINLLNIVGKTTNVYIYADGFSIPLSSIIITRFFLNLRQLAHGSPDDTPRPSFVLERVPDPVHCQPYSLRFASFVGNMDESLMDGSEDDDRDVAWDDDVQDELDNARLNAQIMHDSRDTSAAPFGDPLPEEVMEGERQVDQAAYVEPLV